MNPQGKVSIVTVCYNAVDSIEKTILSVINQTYQNKEYIIIDGASTDGTIDMINKYRDKITFFVSEPDNGIYDAMNKGIKAATGKWINFMNAGDEFVDKNVLSDIAPQMDNADIVYGDTMLVYSIGKKYKRPLPLPQILDKMVFGHQATFVKTGYHKNHLFDLSYKSSADYKFLRDSYIYGAKFLYVPILVANYEAENGISSTNYYRSIREDARIRGIDKSWKWRISFAYFFLVYSTKKKIKDLLPNSFVNYIRRRSLEGYVKCTE